MNPAMIQLAIRALDVIFMGITAWDRYASMSPERRETADRVTELRGQVLAGEITAEQFQAELEQLSRSMMEKRHKAFAALPKPTHPDYVPPGPISRGGE